MEEACRMRIDTVSHSSQCLEPQRSGTNLLHANGHGYASFALFGAETKWKKLVTCEWTQLGMVHSVWS